MLKTLAIVLLALLALLQYRLWLGQGGVMEMNEVSGRVAALEAENQPLRDRNARLSAEVVDLKTGLDAIEEGLKTLPRWEIQGGKLHRLFEFPDFIAAFGFMSRAALIAETLNHQAENLNDAVAKAAAQTSELARRLNEESAGLASVTEATLDRVKEQGGEISAATRALKPRVLAAARVALTCRS